MSGAAGGAATDEHTRLRSAALRTTGAGLIVLAALCRVCVANEAMPYWDADPFAVFTPSTALGPRGMMVLDLMTLVGAAASLWASPWRATRAWLIGAIGAALGVAACVAHAFFIGGGSLDDVRLGSNWSAAVVGGLALWHACRDERVRRLCVAALLGVIGVLAAKGIGQVFIDHPETVAMFKRNREQVLASHGWSPESASARAFERRLMQPEASGWFGLSNVYATLAAGCAVGFAALAVAAWRSVRRWHMALVLGVVCGFAALGLASSKGGYAAAVLGGALILEVVLVARLVKRRDAEARARVIGPIFGLGCIAAPLAAVAVRGSIGERIGELSILFRWFYTVGAARIFASEPLVGVGPAGFKDAYLIHKPPISPEEVTSPHSVLWDWAATLGVGGIGFGVVLVLMACAMGRGLVGFLNDEEKRERGGRFGEPTDHDVDWSSPRNEVRLLCLLALVPMMLGARLEVEATTAEGLVLRLLGAAAAAVISIAAARALRASAAARAAAGAAGLAVVAHTQIEVSGVWSGSACWVMALCGALAPTDSQQRPLAESAWLARFAAGVLGVGMSALSGFGLVAVSGWQSQLEAAAQPARVIAEFRSRATDLLRGTPLIKDSWEQLRADALRANPGDDQAASFGASPDAVLRLLDHNAAMAAVDVARVLVGPQEFDHHHPGTLRAASRVASQASELAANSRALDRGMADAAWRLAEAAATKATTTKHERANSWAWLGTVRATRAARLGEIEMSGAVIEAWERSAALDPHGLFAPVELAKFHASLGRAEDAKRWALRALEVNALLRLDPVKQLTESQRIELERIAGVR